MMRPSKWDSVHDDDAQSRSSLEAAAEAAAKVNAMLIAKGKLKPSQLSNTQTSKQKVPQGQSNLVVTEVDINDVPIGCRNMLTRGSTQDEISKMSGAAVSTRGRFMSPEDKARNVPGERPLYLCVQGPNLECVERAVARIREIIANSYRGKGRGTPPRTLPPMGTRPRMPGVVEVGSPPPLMSINTQPATITVLQEKMFIGLEHAPMNFDARSKLAGPGTLFLQHIMNESQAKVTLRGRGSGFIEPMTGREAFEPMHIHIQHTTMHGLQQAKQLSENLIQTVQNDYAQFQYAIAALPPPALSPGNPTVIARQHSMPPGGMPMMQQTLVPGMPPPSVANMPPSMSMPGNSVGQMVQTTLTYSQPPPGMPPGVVIEQPQPPPGMPPPGMQFTHTMPPPQQQITLQQPQPMGLGPGEMGTMQQVVTMAPPGYQTQPAPGAPQQVGQPQTILLPQVSMQPPGMQQPPPMEMQQRPPMQGQVLLQPGQQFPGQPGAFAMAPSHLPPGQAITLPPQQVTSVVMAAPPLQLGPQGGPPHQGPPQMGPPQQIPGPQILPPGAPQMAIGQPLPQGVVVTMSGPIPEESGAQQAVPSPQTYYSQYVHVPSSSAPSPLPVSTATSTASTRDSQPHKRRFTEEKKEEPIPDNLLGYQHGPPHLTNLVASGKHMDLPPSSAADASHSHTNHNSTGKPDQDRHAGVGYEENDRDHSLMPPPPPPPLGGSGPQKPDDNQLMPPPPPPGLVLDPREPSRKKVKGALGNVAAYGEEEEQPPQVAPPGEDGQSQDKYTFNQYSSKPQIYTGSAPPLQVAPAHSLATTPTPASNHTHVTMEMQPGPPQFEIQHQLQPSPGQPPQNMAVLTSDPHGPPPGALHVRPQYQQYPPVSSGYTQMSSAPPAPSPTPSILQQPHTHTVVTQYTLAPPPAQHLQPQIEYTLPVIGAPGQPPPQEGPPPGMQPPPCSSPQFQPVQASEHYHLVVSTQVGPPEAPPQQPVYSTPTMPTQLTYTTSTAQQEQFHSNSVSAATPTHSLTAPPPPPPPPPPPVYDLPPPGPPPGPPPYWTQGAPNGPTTWQPYPGMPPGPPGAPNMPPPGPPPYAGQPPPPPPPQFQPPPYW